VGCRKDVSNKEKKEEREEEGEGGKGKVENGRSDMRGHPCEKLDERKFALIVECIQTERNSKKAVKEKKSKEIYFRK
jgi:hypothetical protein